MKLIFSGMLTGLYALMRYSAWRHPAYHAQLAAHDFVAQIRTLDVDAGRWFELKAGRVRSRAGLHRKPDVTIAYDTAATAVRLLMPPIDWQAQVEAAKSFQLRVEGPDELVYLFTQAMMATRALGWKFGTPVSNGEHRYTRSEERRVGKEC